MGVLFVGLTNCNVFIKGMGQWPYLWFRCDVITVVLYVGGTGEGFYQNGFPHWQGGGLHLYQLLI